MIPAVLLCVAPACSAQPTPVGSGRADLLGRLEGTGTGGRLVFVNPAGTLKNHFAVQVSVGESAESLRARLQDPLLRVGELNETPAGLLEQRLSDLARSPIAVGGTEVGFGFTPAPKGLAGFADWSRKEITFRWELPAGGYEELAAGGVMSEGQPIRTDSTGDYWRLQLYEVLKAAEGFTPGQMRYNLWGIKDGVPSAPASIWVDNCLFREATDPPPSAGLHPNWGRFVLPGQPTPTLDRGEDPPYVRPRGTIIVDGEPRDARDVFPFKPWHQSPEKKQGYQMIRMPEGATALYRPVVGQAPGDRFEASLLLRIRDRAQLGTNWFVDVLAWNGAPGGLEAEVARHAQERLNGARPDITGRGFIPVWLSSSTPPEAEDWFEASSSPAAGPEGIVIPPGGSKWTLVVIAGNLGGAELGTDWLTVKKLTCSDQIPEGYDPW